MDESTHSEWQCDTDKAYTAPSIELLGSLKELTANQSGNGNGCKHLPGVGQNKTGGNTDGFNNAQTACLS